MWGFWFVFSSVLICSAESSMLNFGLFSAALGKRQILSDCTSQSQFNVWKGFTCDYAKNKICRASHCSHLGEERSCSLVELNCQVFLNNARVKILPKTQHVTSCFSTRSVIEERNSQMNLWEISLSAQGKCVCGLMNTTSIISTLAEVYFSLWLLWWKPFRESIWQYKNIIITFQDMSFTWTDV